MGNSPYNIKECIYNNFPNSELRKAGYSRFFKKGDVLFLTIRANKKIWFADQEGICNSSIQVIIPHQKLVYSEFLITLLLTKNITEWIKVCSKGTTFPTIIWSAFIQKEVFIPSLEEQKKVISHLANLRKYWAKIEQLSQKIEQLSLSLSRQLTLNEQLIKQKLRELVIISRGRTSASENQFNATCRFYTASNSKKFHPESLYQPPAVIIASAWDYASQGEFLIEYTSIPFNASSWVYILKSSNGKNLVSIFCSLKNKRHLFPRYLSATSKIQRLSNDVLKNFSIFIFPQQFETLLGKLLNFSCSTSFFAQRINLLSQYFSEQVEIKTNRLLHPSLT